MTPEVVYLSVDELGHAAAVGVRRRCRSLERGGKPYAVAYQNNPFKNWENDIMGAQGECAYSKWANVYWNDEADGIDEPDFPPNIEIKSVGVPGGPLRIQQKSKDHYFYVLAAPLNKMQGKRFGIALWGWLPGEEAKRAPLVNPRPDIYTTFCHEIRQDQLRPLHTMPRPISQGVA